MSVGLTMGFSICASLLSSIVGRVDTSTGSKTVTAGGGFGVLSRSSAVSVRFSALELRPGYTRFSSDGAVIFATWKTFDTKSPCFLAATIGTTPAAITSAAREHRDD